jgi:hypothetical protein
LHLNYIFKSFFLIPHFFNFKPDREVDSDGRYESVTMTSITSSLGLGHGSKLWNAGGMFGCGVKVRSHLW